MPPRKRHDSGSGSRSRVLQRMREVLSELWVLKTPLLVFVTLTAALPLPLLIEGKESRCAYVLLVMAMLWLTEALPIPVTALLPVFMFPMAGILTATDVGHSYFSNTSMLFIGGLVVAIGVEECNLHKRLALTVLSRVGADPKWIMLGLMLPTWFLSMWISNTATASMMIPIVEAVLQQIRQASDDVGDDDEDNDPADLQLVNTGEDNAFLKVKVEDDLYTKVKVEDDLYLKVKDEKPLENKNMTDLSPGKLGINGDGCQDPMTLENRSRSKGYDLSDLKEMEDDSETTTTTTTSKANEHQHQQLAKGLSLSIAYAANVGGIATITGTPPNLVLKGQVDQFFDRYGVDHSPLTFLEWMAFGFPLALLLLFMCWFLLVALFLKGCCHKQNERQKQAVKATIQREYKALGSITFAEVETLVLFIFLALIWISRDPKVVPGWNVLFEDTYVSDATGAIMVAVLFFILPARKPRVFCWNIHDLGVGVDEAGSKDTQRYKPLLTWEKAQQKLPWGILVLLGGGFALAKACDYSGLSLVVGHQLSTLGSLDPWLLNAIICIAVTMLTEVTSNVATATLLMPIMAELAIRLQVNPLYLMSSSAVATSFAFMMPVATPPNAIVFSHGHLTIPDMAKAGFLMNVIAVLVLTLAVNTWGNAIFDFTTLPNVMRNVTTVVVTSKP